MKNCDNSNSCSVLFCPVFMTINIIIIVFLCKQPIIQVVKIREIFLGYKIWRQIQQIIRL